MQSGAKTALLVIRQHQDDQGLIDLLKQDGYQVKTAASLTEVRRCIKENAIDLILLDVNQTQPDELDLLSRIRAEEGLQETCLIAISSVWDQNAATTSLALGADDLLTVPIDKQLLKSRMHICLEKRRLQAQKNEQPAQDQQSRKEAFIDLETQLRAVISHAPLVLFALTQDGVLITLEGQGLSKFPDHDELVGKNIDVLFKDDPAVLEIAQRTFLGEAFNTYLEFYGAIWEVFVVPIKDDQGHLIGTTGLAADVTHRKLAEIENTHLYHLLQDSHERLQALSNRLMDVQESERQNIARELHDEVGQSLTGLIFALNLGMRQAGEDNEHLAEAQRLARDVLAMVREMSLQLRPAMLDDLGLIPTLEWHFGRYQAQTDIQVDFLQRGLEKGCGSRIETALYRIIQEALTNAARYARVNRVLVNLSCDGQRVNLEVSDRGAGFDLNAVRKNKTSSGLAGMQDRVRLLHGEIEMYSEPDEGTIIKISLPLEPGQSDQSG